MMKKALFFLLLFLLPVLAFAQFPNSPNKIRLGNQTSGDGLVVRTAAAPGWTPSSINNAWLAFDTVAGVFYYYDAAAWNAFAPDNTTANNGLTMSGDTVQLGGALTQNTEIDINGKTFRIRDASDYPDLLLNATYGILSSDVNTYLDVGSTTGRARIVAATTAQVTSAGNSDLSATDTVTISGQRIRLNAADTRIQQVPNDNALNRLMAIDSLTGRLYYVDKSSISSGSVTGSGTTGTIPVWSSSTALGDSPLTVSSGSVTATGTGHFRLPNGSSAQRPGTPSAGMMRYSVENGTLEYYSGAAAWEVPLHSATATGVGTPSRVFYANAAGRAISDKPVFITSKGGINLGQSADASTGPLLNLQSNSLGASDDAPRMRLINTSTTASSGSSYNYASIQNWTGNGAVIGEFSSLYGSCSGCGIGIFAASGEGVYLRALYAHPVIFGTNDAEAMRITSAQLVGIGTMSPQRKLHVTGEARITDLTTDTPTRIVGADADGDLGAITLGSGLSIATGTLSATGSGGTVTSVGITAPAAGITVSGSPITSSGSMTLALANDLSAVEGISGTGIAVRTASETWTTRSIVAGAGMAVTNGDGVSGNPSLSLEFSEGYLSVAGGGTTVTAATPERIDADSPGTATGSILGTEFSVSGSTIDWTGADDSMMKISGTVSFSISDNTDMKVSIYKEGVELAVTEVRVTMVAGDYHTVHLPEIHTAADDNDTFAVYVEPVSGTTTTTVHKSHISIKKLY